MTLPPLKYILLTPVDLFLNWCVRHGASGTLSLFLKKFRDDAGSTFV